MLIDKEVALHTWNFKLVLRDPPRDGQLAASVSWHVYNCCMDLRMLVSTEWCHHITGASFLLLSVLQLHPLLDLDAPPFYIIG